MQSSQPGNFGYRRVQTRFTKVIYFPLVHLAFLGAQRTMDDPALCWSPSHPKKIQKVGSLTYLLNSCYVPSCLEQH